MRAVCYAAILVALVFLALDGSARAAVSGLQLVATNLVSPVYALHAPGDRDRLFIVENGFPFEGDNADASIRILNLKTGVLEPTPLGSWAPDSWNIPASRMNPGKTTLTPTPRGARSPRSPWPKPRRPNFVAL